MIRRVLNAIHGIIISFSSCLGHTGISVAAKSCPRACAFHDGQTVGKNPLASVACALHLQRVLVSIVGLLAASSGRASEM